jgi:hypothetical protein
MAQGSFVIWPADATGNLVGNPTGSPPVPANPSDENAVDIYFGVSSGTAQPPPKDQSDLQADIAKVLRAVQLTYRRAKSTERSKAQFRIYYMRLFRLAQLGLEGSSAAPDVASGALKAVTADLIDDEAGRVKNGHLMRLGSAAAVLAIPFLILYLVLRNTLPQSTFGLFIASLGIQPVVMANFMLLWVGCFVGVWLSYGIRTSVFTLPDLTVTDSDRLVPAIRLLFAGTLSMILGIGFILGLVEIKLGANSVTDFSTKPMLAFLVGAFCGVSELLLPTAVAKRASDLFGPGK